MSARDRLLVLALAAAALLAGALARTGPVEPGAAVAVPAAAVLALELTAPATPAFGFFSAAFAGYLGAALLPGGGARVAVFLLLGGVALRTLLRGRPEPARRAAEALADLVPALGGLVALRVAEAMLPARPLVPVLDRGAMAVGAALVAWVLLTALVPLWLAQSLQEEELMEWEAVRDHLFPLYVGTAVAGVLLPVLAAAAGWVALLLIPVLYALQRGASVAGSRAGEEREHIVASRLDIVERQAVQLRKELQEARQDLRRNVEEYVLLDTFSSTLLSTRALDLVAEATVETARSVLPCRSVVLFLEREGRLVPVTWRSPAEEILSSVALVHAEEPVALRAWEDREACLATPREVAGSRIFVGERSAMAAPLAGLGVLYVGFEAPDAYKAEQLRLLSLVAGQASLALEVSARYEAEQEALRLHQEAHLRLEGWARGMEHLLGGLKDLIGELEPERLRERTQTLLEELVPHDLQAVTLGEPLEGPVQRFVDVVWQNRRPLLLDDVEGSRFEAPAEGIRSVLAVPMLVEGAPAGALVLGSRAPGAFLRQHQDLLFLLGYQAGAAFLSAGYHQDLVETLRKLKESQAQLVQSSKMASVGQLAAGVAHELNTPLGVVLLRLDGALRARDPEKAADRMQKAREAAQRAQGIVAKLLFYSRDAAGVRRQVRLDEVVRDTLEFMGHGLRMENVEVVEDLAPVEPVSADQNELQQVVSNLLVNARDAVLEPGASARQVHVSTWSEGPEVVLRVADSGPGMTDETRARIFDPFFTTKEVGRGTGLGLSVSLEILRAHDGRLEVDSAPGRGASFTVRLPVAPDEDRAPDDLEASTSPAVR